MFRRSCQNFRFSKVADDLNYLEPKVPGLGSWLLGLAGYPADHGSGNRFPPRDLPPGDPRPNIRNPAHSGIPQAAGATSRSSLRSSRSRFPGFRPKIGFFIVKIDFFIV